MPGIKDYKEFLQIAKETFKNKDFKLRKPRRVRSLER